MPPRRATDTEPGALDMLHHRSSDPPVRIVRDIPLWGILTVVGGMLVQAVVLWSQTQTALAQQKDIATDVRTVRDKVDQISARSIRLEAQLESMERRISLLESQRGAR